MLATLDRGSAQLAYLDPPFNSGRGYDARLGSSSRSSTAFNDDWKWDDTAEAAFRQLPDAMPLQSARLITSLIKALGRCDMSAYLVMMAPRLAQLRRVLSDTGSLYVHCDPAASHYLKVILDLLFGPENFRNEIIWKRTHAHSSSRRFGPVHDVILFYGMSTAYTWNQLFAPYDHGYLEKYFTHEDEHGRYQLITCTAPGPRPGTRAHYPWRGQFPPTDRHWAWTKDRMEELDAEGRLVHSPNGVPRLKRYVDDGEGVRLQDIWTDIYPLGAHAKERTGYETQKPLALLSRIIHASSSPGDLVVDPFVGSGTTAVAAEIAGRSWAVADSSLLAAALTLSRVRAVEPAGSVTLPGFPSSERAAKELLLRDPTEFAVWATAMLGTLLDTAQTTRSLAIGVREAILSAGTGVNSWIPLACPAAEPDRLRGKPTDRHAVLLTNRGVKGLATRLARLGAEDVVTVPLGDVVMGGALERGGVAALLT
jgi:DNA modification methylase